MHAVAQVAQPRLQGGRVVLLDQRSVRLDACCSAHGGPFAGHVQEGNVYVRVGLQLVRLARLGVGVEEEVDAARFLRKKS